MSDIVSKKQIQSKYFEEFELVNPDAGKQYAGISEKAVDAIEYEIKKKDGTKTNLWRLYNSEGIHIATINGEGKIKLSDQYIEMLKYEKDVKTNIVGQRYIESLVPIKDRNIGKEIDEMSRRQQDEIAKIDMEQRIKQEQDKQKTDDQKQMEDEQLNQTQVKQEAPKPEEIEKATGKKVSNCTVIKDKRFYDDFVETKKFPGLVVIAYSEEQKAFIVFGKDYDGNFKELETIEQSRTTAKETTSINRNSISSEGIGYILEGRPGSEADDKALSVRLNGGSGEIQVRLLTMDEKGESIANELVTDTQRPTREEVLAERNSHDEVNEINETRKVIDDFKKAGIELNGEESVKALTEEDRSRYEIFTIEEIEEQIEQRVDRTRGAVSEDEVKREVFSKIEGYKAEELTAERVEVLIERSLNNVKERNMPEGPEVPGHRPRPIE